MRQWKTLLMALTAGLLVGLLAACGSADPAATPTQAAVSQGPVPTPTTAVTEVVAGTTRSGDIVGTGADTAPTAMAEKPELGGTINYVSCCSGTVTASVDPWNIAGAPYGHLWWNSPIQMKFPFNPAKGVEYEGGVATEWSQSEDGTKWTLKLRQGVTFHDGEMFNADDMVATTERMLDDKFLIATRQVPMRAIFTSITKVDDYTVVLDTGDKPNSVAFAYLSAHHFAIVPEHLIKGDPTSPDVETRWKYMNPEKKDGEPGTQATSGTLGIRDRRVQDGELGKGS